MVKFWNLFFGKKTASSTEDFMQKYLIVGLGNIGDEYVNTRHNIGFDVVDALAKKNAVDWRLDRLAFITQYKLKGKLVTLIKPTTYMNLSGKALKYWMDKEKITLENVFVIVDDLALPLEKFRVRESGSDAGHNGLKDIQFVLQSNKYSRLRFGIGNVFAKGEQVSFVLGKWKPKEQALITQKIDVATTIIEKFILEGVTNAMNFCNSLTISN
jgi:PTH1 family peptidyl-tRNA hydrolase